MTNKQLMETADEAGIVRPADYQEAKDRLNIARAEFEERLKENPELMGVLRSIVGKDLAKKRRPENMRRKPWVYERAKEAKRVKRLKESEG